VEFQKTDFLSPSFFKRLQGQLVAFFGSAFSPPYLMPFELKVDKSNWFYPFLSSPPFKQRHPEGTTVKGFRFLEEIEFLIP